MYLAITLDGDGYRARAYGSNGELVWWTEGYTNKSSATDAINILKTGAATAPVFDRT